ncbi:MAG TPA: hypothetical protein VF546_01170 [Pyrinomonadaceae bacterium]|jgi:hypothetical protein
MNVFALLAMLTGLGSLIIFIIVLIKLFQNEGALKGILGLICSIYTFIWGWMNAGRLNIRNLMLIWTALIILGIVLNLLGGGMAAMQTPTTP